MACATADRDWRTVGQLSQACVCPVRRPFRSVINSLLDPELPIHSSRFSNASDCADRTRHECSIATETTSAWWIGRIAIMYIMMYILKHAATVFDR